MLKKSARVNDRIPIISRDDVNRLLASADPLWPSRVTNFYLVRQNGEHVSAKSIVYELSQGEKHWGNEAALALLHLEFQVHVRRSYPTHEKQPWARFHDEGLLIFDDEPKGPPITPIAQTGRSGAQIASDQCDALEKELDAAGEFDPHDEVDGRERTTRAIVCRRGQQKFRDELLRAYSNRCSVTDCNAVEVLEAAHVLPYNGPATNHVSNGLLLRSDVHTLFDLGMISVDADQEPPCVVIGAELESTVYRELAGKMLRLPTNPKAQPDKRFLREHRSWAKL